MQLIRRMLIVSLLLFAYCLIMLAVLIPWVWVAVLISAALALCKERKHFHAFGTARWADINDLRGMVDEGDGLIIGQMEDTTGVITATKGLFDASVPAEVACQRFLGCRRKRPLKLVRLNRAVHTAIFAPTGAGKGVSFVIPFLLTCKDSCVVVDLKAGELARITAQARRKMGHRVVLLDPFKKVTATPDTLNPLEFIDRDDPYAIDNCRETAAAMVERKEEKGDGVHFLDNAEGGIAAIAALLVQFGEGENKSLQALCDIVSNPQKWQKAIELMCGSDAWDGLLARMGGSLMHLKERELASSISTIARFVRFLSTPAIAASTRSSTFNPADLVRQKMTVYLILPPERASALSPLLRLWIGSLLRVVVKGGLQEKNKVHFVCDEAHILGKMDQISDALTIGRGFGLRMQLYYQDCGQLKKCWPDGADQTLLANVSQVFFAVNDTQTGKYIEERLGKSTIIIESGGTSSSTTYQRSEQGQSSGSYSHSSNDNWQQSGRELLQASEIMNLPERIAITFTPGVPPIWTTLIRYYESGFGKAAGQFWPSVRAFAEAAIILAGIGFFTVLVTLAVHRKFTSEQGFFPVANEQRVEERR
ncbi:MAG: type IV secretory system conjugative DNA transfer family protein [Gemmataceae bacterium]